MSISIVLDTEDCKEDNELCIFCQNPTAYWTVSREINRPVCPVCSLINNVSDVPNATYNY